MVRMSDPEDEKQYKQYEKKIKGYSKEFKEIKQFEIPERERIQKMLDLSAKALEKENYKRLDTIFTNIEELVKVSKQKMAIEKLTKALNSIEITIQKLEDEGADVEEMKKLFDSAKNDLDNKAYGETKKGALQIRDMIKKIPDKKLREMALKTLSESSKEDAKKADEGVVEEPEDKDKPAKKEPEEDDPVPPPPEGAAEDDLNEDIKLTWSRIKDAKAKGLDMEEAIEALDKARDAFKTSDNDNAKTFIEESNKLIETAQKSTKILDLKSKLDEVNDLVNQIDAAAKEYGQEMNTKDIQDLLEKSKLLIDSGESDQGRETLEKANWHANQMMNTLMKNEEKKAISSLKDTKLFLKDLKERGVNIEKAKEVFKEAEPALATGDFKKVIQKARESRELAETSEKGHSEVEAQELVNYVNDMVSELNSLRVDFEKLEGQINEFLDLFEKNDFEAVLSKGDDLKNQLYFLKMEKMKEEAQDSITEISNLLLELRDQQVTNLHKADQAFANAQDSFNMKEYERSLEHSEEALKELHAHLKNIIGEKLNELKETIEYIDELDVRPEEKEKIKAYYDTAKKFFDAEEVMKAKTDIQSGKTKAGEALKSFCTEKMVSIQMAMSDIQSRTEGTDAGFTDVENLFVEFGKKFKNQEYEEALKTSHEVEMKLNLYLSSNVAETIKEVEVHIPKLKDHGINVLEVTEALLDIKSLVSEQKYVQGYQKITKVKEELDNATRDKATGQIVSVQEEIDKIREKGYDTKKMEGKFKELTKKFGENRFIDVIEIAQDIQKLIEEEELYQNVVEDLLLSKLKIQEADSLGCDIAEAATLLQNARPLLESNHFEEALDISRKCREFTQGIIEKTMGIKDELKVKVEEKIATIEQKFNEVRNTGIDITRADGMYEQTKKAQELGDFSLAFKIANECLDELDKESKLYSELSDAISQAKSKISEGKNNGLDVTQAETLFNQMGPALDGKDYETIKNLSRRIVEEIVKQEEGIKRQQTAAGDSKKVVLEEVGRAQSAIDDLKNQGIEPKKAIDLFQQIVPEMQAGNLEKAIELAQQSRETADSLAKLYKDFQGRLEEVATLIATTKESGILVNEAEQIFDSIQQAIGEGDMIKARDQADKCVKEVELTSLEMEKAMEQIREIDIQLKDAQAYGLNPPNAPRLLNQAREAFKIGDYKKVLQFTNEGAMDIMSVIPE